MAEEARIQSEIARIPGSSQTAPLIAGKRWGKVQREALGILRWRGSGTACGPDSCTFGQQVI